MEQGDKKIKDKSKKIKVGVKEAMPTERKPRPSFASAGDKRTKIKVARGG